MSLHFILDGYNLIKSENSDAFTGMNLRAQREKLQRLIIEHNPQGSQRNKVTVVFDGTYENSLLPSQSADGIDVVFSAGDTADKVIVDIVNETRNPSVIVVVTDDKGIKYQVGSAGAKTLGTKEFFTRLFKKTSKETSTPDPEQNIEIYEELAKEWLK